MVGPRRINGYYEVPERLQALISVHQTAENLFTELQRVQSETIALIKSYNKEMEQRKDYLWWMTFEIWITEDEAMNRINTIMQRQEQFAA